MIFYKLLKTKDIICCVIFCSIILSHINGQPITQEKIIKDSVQSASLLILCDSFRQKGEHPVALTFAKEALSTVKNNNRLLQVMPLCEIGVCYYYLNQLDSAVISYKTALGILLDLGLPSDKQIGVCYNDLGVFYTSLGDYREALNYHIKGIAHAKKYNSGDLVSLATSYSTIGTAYQYLNELDSALLFHKKAFEIREEKLGNESKEAAHSLYSIATCYGQLDRRGEQIELCLKVLEIYEKNDESNLLLWQVNNELGEAYNNIDNFEKAIEQHKKSLKNLLRAKTLDSLHISITYNNLGRSYFRNADHQGAKKNYLKALASFPKKLAKNHPYMASFYSNIGVLYSFHDSEKSLFYYQKAINIRIRKFGEFNSNLSSSYHNLSIRYFEKEDYEKALNLSKKAIKSHLEDLPNYHSNLVQYYVVAGDCLIELGQYEKAKEYFEKADKIEEYLLAKGQTIHKLTDWRFGMLYYEAKDYAKAIHSFNKSLTSNIRIKGEINPVTCKYYWWFAKSLRADKQYNQYETALLKGLKAGNFKEAKNLSQVNNLQIVIQLLSALGSLYVEKYKSTEQNGNNIDKARNYYLQALECLNYQINSTELNPSQDYREQFKLIYEGLIKISLLDKSQSKKQSIIEAFCYSEKSQASILLQSILDKDALSFLNDSATLKNTEYANRLKISSLEKKVYELSLNDDYEKDTNYLNISTQLYNLKEENQSLKNELLKKYPEYQASKTSCNNLINDLSNLLGEKQTFLEYFVGDSSIFTFVITNDTFYINQAKKDFPLKQYVQNMREGIYQPFQNKKLSTIELDSLNRLYTESAYKLYEKLILPVKKIIPKQRELIIVPDGVLGYIPFDALLTQPIDKSIKIRDYPYLLKDYQTSVAYSATLLKEMKGKKHRKTPSKNFLGIAPLFNNGEDSSFYASRFIDYANKRNRLGTLDKNIPEVKNLQEIVGGDILIDAFATKQAFLQNAENYKVLHLSTHGKANDKIGDYSFLAFYQLKDSLENEWLYNRELYDLNLNADMVVLSACETGIGELQRGEGIISLARGFSYAGAKSIITSLWTVDDTEAPILMEGFYNYLYRGYTKDAALRQAKLDYLQTSPKPEPYFWATFIPIGDMQPINFHNSTSWWVWGLLAGGLLLVTLFFWRKNM